MDVKKDGGSGGPNVSFLDHSAKGGNWQAVPLRGKTGLRDFVRRVSDVGGNASAAAAGPCKREGVATDQFSFTASERTRRNTISGKGRVAAMLGDA